MIRSGQQSYQLNERFIQERQILASLEHPGISRLIDGGTTEKGDAFLVMELIDGISIVKYCDQHQLTTKQIARLFIQVCDVVHYAHQNLIIHRDITPDNIFVNEDGKVKLLDFGIAKLVEALGGSSKTQTGLNPLDPDFASPEQILDAL